MKKYLLLFAVLSLFLCKTATADFYQWVDEKGNTQITDYPPPENKAAKDVQVRNFQSEDVKKSQEKVESETDTSQNEGGSEDDKSSKEIKETDIVLYTKNNCPDCNKARDFLKAQKAVFTEYNIETDKKAAAKRKEIDDSLEVPFALIYKYQVFGFSESTYKKALKKTP